MQALLQRQVGLQGERCKVKKVFQCYQTFIHSFCTHFLHVVQEETQFWVNLLTFPQGGYIIESQKSIHHGKKAKQQKLDFSKIKSVRLLFGIMLLLSEMRCVLVCVENMLIIIDKKLSSTSCHSHHVLKIKTGYRAKIHIQEIV